MRPLCHSPFTSHDLTLLRGECSRGVFAGRDHEDDAAGQGDKAHAGGARHRTVSTGAADAQRYVTGRLRIGYKPARPVPARLAVSVETVQDSAPQTAFVTIPPKQVT